MNTMNTVQTLSLGLCALALTTAGLTACGSVDTSSVRPTMGSTTSDPASPIDHRCQSGGSVCWLPQEFLHPSPGNGIGGRPGK